MSTSQIWSNVVAYSLQVGLLVGIGALMPSLLKLQSPRTKLLFWQALLIACLILPWVQPWRQEVVRLSNVEIPAVSDTISASAVTSLSIAVRHRIPFTTILLYLLAAGAVIRFASLCIGLAKLAGYRRRGRTFKVAAVTSARLLVSDEIPSPVTFGWRDPVVLLPERFPALLPELRDAILCHELIHVERNDWLVMLAEELIRAIFWFHPAIWWVLGEIQLSREQTVDGAVVEITNARGHYLDALLAMAQNSDQLDLAPAPLFLRRRHLRQRIAELLTEGRLPPFLRIRLALAVMAIASGGWIVSGAFPLAAAPQFAVTRPPADTSPTNPTADPGIGTVTFNSRTIWMDGTYVVVVPSAAPNALGHPLTDIRIAGLSNLAVMQLKSRLPVQTGDVWGNATASIVNLIVKDFDPHLEVAMVNNPANREWSLWIGPAAAAPVQPAIVSPLPAEVKPPTLLTRVDPAFTDRTKSARIAGNVKLSAVVNTDGRAQSIRVIGSLDPELDHAAAEALARWRFRPGTKDGTPVSVQTQVNFNFRMM